MPASMIRKFASDACTVIQGCQEFISELSAEIDAKNAKIAELEAEKANMSKVASAPAETKVEAAVVFDEDMLQKAASAVHAVYGSPANVSAEDIINAWKDNPGYTLGVINKLASELQNRNTVSASDLGKPMNKKASAGAELSADEAFRNKYI